MRNHITPIHCAVSTPSAETRDASIAPDGTPRLKLVRTDRDHPAGACADKPREVVPSSYDFEGFGSFSG
ncbi:hypothetical protein MKK58_12775 [Methylobacterium sp. J-078]|uniref:hypothetical protein n=1 Tax=Methylobacterium sp. J-078 TaxID=2836657 RepID=UPI001FBA4672|nr:hypothetical protein [Methylobacterium sp. J-078]MCJ2045396.1 hypothetical protein [Methylobacterium sp. J-078]